MEEGDPADWLDFAGCWWRGPCRHEGRQGEASSGLPSGAGANAEGASRSQPPGPRIPCRDTPPASGLPLQGVQPRPDVQRCRMWILPDARESPSFHNAQETPCMHSIIGCGTYHEVFRHLDGVPVLHRQDLSMESMQTTVIVPQGSGMRPLRERGNGAGLPPAAQWTRRSSPRGENSSNRLNHQHLLPFFSCMKHVRPCRHEACWALQESRHIEQDITSPPLINKISTRFSTFLLVF